MNSKRQNLVVCCVGDESLHTSFTEPHRNFDLCLMYFGDKPSQYRDQCEHYLTGKGTQPVLLDRVFRSKPELLDLYSRFWIPDDDLETSTEEVNQLFEIFEHSDFDIAQPSLTSDSDASISMLTCKNLGSCKTNFIEIMCPLFTQDALRESVQYFTESSTGWGIDELFSVRTLERGGKLGVFDQIQVGHYRPVGDAQWYQSLEVDPLEELKALKKKHGLPDRLKRRIHPLYEPQGKPVRNSLPQSSPFILGGQGGSCTRAVAEILFRTNRIYLDMDSSCDHPETMDSFCMRTEDWNDGLIQPELIMQILATTGSTDYQMTDLPNELQQELLNRGQIMRDLIAERAKDGTDLKKALNRLGEIWCNRQEWGWKEPRSLYYLPLWKALFGRFRFIHIVRDPRTIRDRHIEGEPEFQDSLLGQVPDDLQSGFELFWARTNMDAHRWAMREMPHHYLLVRVEDLAGQDDKAHRATSRLLNFTGLDFADRAKIDAVFKPLREVELKPRTGELAAALEYFGYVN